MFYTWNVPLIAQPDFNRCWEAAARMMWHWQHAQMGAGAAEGLYRRRARQFARMTHGLADWEVNQLAMLLGMGHRFGPSVAFLLGRLRRGPVMMYLSAGSSGGQAQGHAVVIVRAELGPSSGSGTYTIADPCAFGFPRRCRAGLRSLLATTVEADAVRGYIWYWP